MARKVQVLATDGRSLRDLPDSAPEPISVLDELADAHQRLDAVLPAQRPRERLGGLAAARAAEREKARASIEGTNAIGTMRAAGKNVRAIAEAHKAAVEAAKQDRFLSAAGRVAKLEELQATLDKQLVANANAFKAAESELLTRFHGRSTNWIAMRDKAAPVASTTAAAAAVANLLPLWTPEATLARLEQAVDERDVVLLSFAADVVKNLLSTDSRYASLQVEAETLLEDVELAMGDENTDAKLLAKALADEMRAELNGASKLVLKNQEWDPVLDTVGILKAFESPYSDSGAEA